MGKCSICKQQGHNKRKCPQKDTCQVVPKKKEEINLKKTPLGLNEYNDMLQDMKINRKNQYDLANDCVQSLMEGKNVSIKAEEKSGKRIIMECIHVILNINHKSSIVTLPRSVYITALNRKDTKPQFEEQESFGITSIVAGKSSELLDEIVKIMNEPGDSMVYIHLDECDYGTGNTQALSKLYLSPELETHKSRIKFITYSATSEEVILSEKIDEPQWSFHEFIPHEAYFGAQKYLDNDLVFEPSIFYDNDDFTEDGKKIIVDMKEHLSIDGNKRNIAVVRDTTPGMLGKIKSKIESLETQYECIVKVYDQNEPFEWGNQESWSKLGRIEILNDDLEHLAYNYIPVVIFISQICTRSTEICPLGHRRLYAWHDARMLSDKKAFNTLSQAIGRVKHYTQFGHPENKIKLYCDIDILNITLGKELENTEKTDLIIAQRVARKVVKDSKFVFDGFQDGYKTIHDVPLSEWKTCDPNGGKIKFKSVNGKWCHYDGKPRYFGNDISLGNTDHKQDKNVLQYESETSDRYIIRKAKFVENKNYSDEIKVDFVTNEKSMYA
jgi:hypothetical protein